MIGVGLGIGSARRLPVSLSRLFGASLKLVLDGDSLTAAGGLVSAWGPFTAAGSARPSAIAAGLDGRQVVRFNGSANVMAGVATNTLVSLAAFTVYTVAKLVGAPSAAPGAGIGAKNGIYCDTSAYVGLVADSTPEVVGFTYDAGYKPAAKAMATGAFQRIRHSLSGTTGSITVGTAAPVTVATAGAMSGSGTMQLGKAQSVFCSCEMAYQIWVNRASTAAEDAAVSKLLRYRFPSLT